MRKLLRHCAKARMGGDCLFIFAAGSAPVWKLEVYADLGREGPVSDLVADVAEGLRTTQTKLRIVD